MPKWKSLALGRRLPDSRVVKVADQIVCSDAIAPLTARIFLATLGAIAAPQAHPREERSNASSENVRVETLPRHLTSANVTVDSTGE